MNLPSSIGPLLIIIIITIAPANVSTVSPVVSASAEDPVRIILPTRTPETDSQWLRGCEVIHVLIDGISASCPGETARYLLRSGLVVEDRLVRLSDLESDVYINADDSWSLGFNGTSVKVAVLDTGIDKTHPELSDSILATANFAAGPNIDKIGHGTHVAGIVTANGGRKITGGAAHNLADPNEATGSSPGAFILAGRVCRDRGCFTSDIEKGIEWAVQQGARVINLSLGGGNFGSHCDGDRLASKANWAVDQGVVVVASSGNDASGVSSPACGSKVIAVGAVYQRDIGPQDYSPTCIDNTTSTDQIVCFSNKGSALDVVAPGAGILSTYSCNAAGDCSRVWYAWGWGTSQAAPHVAAVAALILSVNPNLSPSEVKNIIETTARDLGPAGRDDTYGSGVVDAFAAVRAAGAVPKDVAVMGVTPEKTVTYDMINARPLQVNATVQNLGTRTESFIVRLKANSTEVASANVTAQPQETRTATLQWNTTSTAIGTYQVTVTVEALVGEFNVTNNTFDYGTVHVNFPGDTNSDCAVNFLDLGAIGGAFLSGPSSDNWQPAADINNDLAVNFLDLGITGSNFLRECPP